MRLGFDLAVNWPGMPSILAGPGPKPVLTRKGLKPGEASDGEFFVNNPGCKGCLDASGGDIHPGFLLVIIGEKSPKRVLH